MEEKKLIIYPRTISSGKLERHNIKFIENCFCPNGHSLIDSSVNFSEHPSIAIKLRHNKELIDLFISPLIGDKCKVSFDKPLSPEKVYEFICPECNVALPVFSPCSCGGDLIAIYLDKDLKFRNIAAICNRVDCPHSEIKGQAGLKSIYM